MAEKYSSDLLRVVVAQIAQTIGYSNTQSAPVELLEDILHRFIQELARNLHSQTEHANRIEPNLKDLFVTLKILGIDVYELLDYIGNVEPVPFCLEVPKYPIKRDPSLNFLKPGSSETLTRPVHIFEYLPAILPAESYRQDHEVVSQSPLRDAQNQNQKKSSQLQDAVSDFIPSWRTQKESMNHLLNTSSKDNMDNDIQVVREISSVVMTTGGFISPAIEGKLPEAFVPNIIDKFKGLDAPPDTSPPPISETIKTYSNKDVSADVPINTKMMFELTPFERSDRVFHVVESTPSENTFFNTDQSIDLPNAQSSSLIKTTKLEKKNKKKHLIGQRKYQTGEDNNMNKAQDKAHRKALKLYQKISKTQNTTISFKKSMKNLNRGLLSGLQEKPNERMQLEKIIKKQTKQRQKQMKSQKHQQRQEVQLVPPIIPNCKTSILPVVNEVDVNERPLTVVDTSDNQIKPDMATSNVNLIDERKLSSEPDRNKLNIFKKISKQKSTKVVLSNTLNNSGSNLLESTNNSGSSLINLPSGTTITPAPSFNAVNNVEIPSSHMPSEMIKMPLFPDPNRYFESSEKPKKRGRKPGGKNQIKPPPFSEFTTSSDTQINSTNKINITKLASPSHLSKDCTNIEPLNLTNVDQLKATQIQSLSSNDHCNEVKTFNHILRLPKVKEKRDRKKSKPKIIPSQAIVDQFSDNKQLSQLTYPMDEHAVNIEKSVKSTTTNNKGLFSPAPSVMNDGYLRGALGSQCGTNIHSSNMIYASNQRNIIPMLPMLHFPPRPGLIPTGIFPPTNLTSFSQQVCSAIPNNIIPNPFTTFSTGNKSTTSGNRSSLNENGDNLSSRPLLTSLPVPELHLERGYCNVAPLVPESMKLTTTQGISDSSKTECSESITKDMSMCHTLNISKCAVSSHEISNQPKSPAIQTLPTTATGNLGDPIEVSDDSNDTDLNVTNKIEEPISALPPHTFVFKSSKCQVFTNAGTEKHAGVQPHSVITSQLYIPDSKQLKKVTKPTNAPLKKNHHSDKNLLSSPFNINYMGNDKFSLAGGADLIPLSRIDSGQAYSSQTVPSTSLTAGSTSSALPSFTLSQTEDSNCGSNFVGSVKYEDITITPTSSIAVHDLKMNKLHKKLKKTKEGKVKKKKDKKEKTKNKDKKDEKKMLNSEKSKSPDKKLKKKREKLADELQNQNESSEYNKPDAHSSSLFLDSIPVGDPFPTVHQTTTFTDHLLPSKVDVSTNQVPKLTLKLGEKLAYIPKELDEGRERNSGTTNLIDLTPPSQIKREHSPELARFSPLVTGPPKPKPSETQPSNTLNESPPLTNVSTTSITPQPVPMSTGVSNYGASSSHWISATEVIETGSPVASSSTLSASSVLLPQQLMQPSKPFQNIPSVPQIQTKESQVMPTQSQELSRPSSYVDAEGYRIWICPACGKVDDGSAMIGCDGCDAWYHWVCVGILIAPNDNEDWFCRVCVAKRKLHGLDKKKKRNKKK